jgi:3-oxoadipate enol-lactonase
MTDAPHGPDGSVRHVQADGIRLAYRTWGAAQAPPLVLVHALGETSRDWSNVAPTLAASRRVYAPDLRGHGDSDWSGPYTIERLTSDLSAFLDVLTPGRLAIAGHSIGGPPAYLYAARHPERVTRLVLEDPAPPWPRAQRALARPEGQGQGRSKGESQHPPSFDWHATALRNEFVTPQVNGWRKALLRIQARTLIIAGGTTSHIDQGQLAGMAALTPRCELVTIPAGHRVHAARPAQFTAAVAAFLE